MTAVADDCCSGWLL